MLNLRRAQIAFVLGSAFLIAGCDSTQPDRIQSRTATLSFEARANAYLFNCYEQPSVRCFQLFDEQNPTIPRKEPRSVPWRYSVQITIIRAGGVQEELAISTTGVVGSSVDDADTNNDFVSLSNYDPSMPAAPDRTEGGVTYTDGHQVSTGNPLYLSTIFVDPGLTNLLDILAEPPSTTPEFEFTMNSGDTVIVRARKELRFFGPQVNPPYEDLTIQGTLVLSGVSVAVQGTSMSSVGDGEGFTFSFSVQ